MATYYGYKEREDPKKSMIDWASITKDITTNLYAEAKRREEEKSTLEQDYIKQLNSLNEYSQGLDPTLNSAMLSYAQNYRDYLLENHKMMKAGVISVNDSKLAKQGAQDSFTNLNNMVTSLNGEVQKLMDKGGNVNEFLAQFAANTLDFKNQQLLIDQKTGSGSFARLKEDGTIDKNTIVPFAAASQMFQPYDVVDINKLASDATKDLGKIVTADSAYYSLSDIRQNKEYYENWMNTTLDSMTNGKKLIEVASALGYEVGDAASGTTMKANTEGGRVNFELTPEQQKDVREKLRAAIEMRIDSEEKRKEIIDRRSGPQIKQDRTFNLINLALSGSESSMKALARQAGFQDYNIKDGQLVFIDKQGKPQVPINLTDQTIANAGTELAAALGLDSELFRTRYQGEDKVSGDVLKYADYSVPRTQTFNTTENLNAMYEAITEAEGNDKLDANKVVIRQLNALAAPYGIPDIVEEESEDGTEIAVINLENGEKVVLGRLDNPPGLLKNLDTQRGVKRKGAKGDVIFSSGSEIVE